MQIMDAGEQLDFGFRTPRKRRRKRRGRPHKPGAGVPHRPRAVQARHPLHVTFKVRRHVWQLRSRRCYSRIRAAFQRVAGRFETRIAHFSVQHDHLHMLVETKIGCTERETSPTAPPHVE